MKCVAYDAALKNRQYNKDGHLTILRTRISKATVNPYYGREIPNSETLGLDPDRIYYLLRDPGELTKAAESFKIKPLMRKHVAVSADNPNQEYVVGSIGSDVYFEWPYLIADLCVWDAGAIAGIETDTVRELSSSYHYTADMTPGVFEGQTYDGVMRNIAGNHVALVEQGRAGSDVMAADSGLETDMKETKFGKLIYAILCAASPKLAKDAALKPLVIGLTKETLDAAALEPKLLAMDAALVKEPITAAMDAAKEMDDKQEDDEQGKDKKARDKKVAKDCSCGAKDGKHAKDCNMAKDAEEDDDPEPKAKDKKRANDVEGYTDEEGDFRPIRGSKGYSKGKGGDAAIDKAMDEFKQELREADEARRAVRSVVGDVLAHDSAAGIYGFALDQMKVDHAGVEGVPALRALFNLAVSTSKDKAPARPAFDAAAQDEIKRKFPHASREIRVM